MRLTKTLIKEKQAQLVEVLIKLEKLGKEKKSLVAALDDDFAENEEKYRNGVVTPNGILVRKPERPPSPQGHCSLTIQRNGSLRGRRSRRTRDRLGAPKQGDVGDIEDVGDGMAAGTVSKAQKLARANR